MKRQAGFTLMELLVVVAIVGVLVGLLLPAVQKTREAAARLDCCNNLKQIVLAVHSYDNVIGYVPSLCTVVDWSTFSSNSVYWWLMPYLEENNNNGDMAVKTYMCPSRRDPSVGNKADYGFCDESITGHPAWFHPQWRTLTTNTTYEAGANLTIVTNADGLSNTAYISHKGLPPRYYRTDIPGSMGNLAYFDMDWYVAYSDAVVTLSCMRSPIGFVRDRDEDYGWSDYLSGTPWLGASISTSCLLVFSSPHSTAPTGFCDGSVRNIPLTRLWGQYDYTQANPDPSMRWLILMWIYNDGQALPELDA